MEEDYNQDEIPEGCTCHDEFVTAPCPVHSVTPEIEPKFGEDVNVLTDANLSPDVYGSWEGFKFICPECQVPSIMVNRDMGTRCSKCGMKVLIRSKTVTDFVRNLEKSA